MRVRRFAAPIMNRARIVKRGLRRQSYRSRGKRIVHFLHVGKTGGTALRHALDPHRVTPRHALELHGHEFRLRDVPPGDQAVFFLRDPISRFVSGFCSRQRKGLPRSHRPWRTREAAAFREFQTPNELANALSCEDSSLRNRAFLAMRSIGHVRTSFLDWLESEEYFLTRLPDILLFGFQESLAEDFAKLKRLLQLSTTIQLPDDPVQAHRRLANQSCSLDSLAIENLLDWYAADYDFLALCKSLRAEDFPRSAFWDDDDRFERRHKAMHISPAANPTRASSPRKKSLLTTRKKDK